MNLNALLDAEADRLVGAERYERSEGRRDHRSGHYERKLQTRAGEVTLKVPRLRRRAALAATQLSRRRSSSDPAGMARSADGGNARSRVRWDRDASGIA